MTFEIPVKTYMGFSFSIDVEPNETIGAIQMKIQIQEGIFWFLQRIIFRGQQLDTHKTLNDCGISEGSSIDLVLRLCWRGVIKVGPSDYLYDYFGAPNILITEVKKIICDKSEQDYQQFFETFDLLGKHGRCKDYHTFNKEDRAHEDVMVAVLDLKTKDGGLWYLDHKMQMDDKKRRSLVFGYVRSFTIRNQLKYHMPTELNLIINQYVKHSVIAKESVPQTMTCAWDDS
eukprot:515538_1